MKTIEEMYLEFAASKGVVGAQAAQQITILADSHTCFLAGAAAMASLFAAQPIQLRGEPAAGDGAPQWQPRGGDQGAFDTQNMGPLDPRSFNRRCVHGKLPAEPCDLCSNADFRVPRFDANGSPVA